MTTLNHKFETISQKTARKDGTKYLGKDGTQAWYVSVKIGEDWYGNMIYDEALLPNKGTSYNIELEDNGTFKNWKYKLMTKKEQVLEQAKMTAVVQQNIPPPMDKIVNEEPPKNLIGRGASFNLAFQYCLENKPPNDINAFPGGVSEIIREDFENFMERVSKTAEKILTYQDRFVNH